MRPARKSRERGLFKECDHLWDSCACPWLGRVGHVRRVNLAKWAAVGKRKLNRTEAINILADVRAAVLAGTFSPSGRQPKTDASKMTFAAFLDHYEQEELRKR